MHEENISLDVSENEFYKKLLRDNIKQILGEFDETILSDIEDMLSWLELPGGEVLMKEGDPGDSLYFLLSGRLMATVKQDDNAQQKIGEIVRGETVGELALYTGEPRVATVSAIRDSVLVKLSREVFEGILLQYPRVSLNVTKIIIQRFRKTQNQKKHSNFASVCFLPIHKGLQTTSIVEDILQALSSKINICKVDHTMATENFGKLYHEHEIDPTNQANKRLIQWLNNLEAVHDMMFYICDEEDTVWNKKCLRQADHIILLADANQSSDINGLETKVLHSVHSKVSLVLIHNNTQRAPENTENWLKVRPWVQMSHHIRKNNTSDIHRLARIISGNAIGIVFAGGGAKGFAHIGVLKALEEYGIVYDYLGGTSIGALIAGSTAFDAPINEVKEAFKMASKFSPSGDFNLIPIISLVKGKNLKQLVEMALTRLAGHNNLGLLDAWKNNFMVASNFSNASEEVFERGDMIKSMLASSALPGIFPPIIINGDIFVDGGAFNNFPVDVMKEFGANKVIGIDFLLEKNTKLDIEYMPTNFEMFKEKFRSKKNNKLEIPKLTSTIINSTVLYSVSKRKISKDLLDLHFNPDVANYGLTSWTDFEKIVEKGYQHAKEVLQNLPKEQLDQFRDFEKEQ